MGDRTGARMQNRRVRTITAVVVINVVVAVLSVSYLAISSRSGASLMSTNAVAATTDPAAPRTSTIGAVSRSVELNEKQLASVRVDVVGDAIFPIEKAAVGSIDFNEDMTLQVFSPYQGRILELFGKVGDEVARGQTLFTIDSPDLLAADSNLIAAAGVLELTTRNLARLKTLYETRAVSQKDLEQAISDQQTAEGNLRAARDAVRIFGKNDGEIDQIIKQRKADPRLVVPSPIAGRITARNAAPGLFVQPGNAPAPYSVADVSTMWMLANVAESDVSAFHVGQEVKVSLLAFPGKVFDGRLSTINSNVDPNTHRMLIRSEVDDPKHELRAGMFATFIIRTGDPVRSLAVPLSGLVREGDGTMTAWVTNDRRRFTQRVVRVGDRRGDLRQILDGLTPGELIATDGAIFLSNMLAIGQAGQ